VTKCIINIMQHRP